HTVLLCLHSFPTRRSSDLLARTTSASSRLSMVRPNLRVKWPDPPPRVSPATPVVETMPKGTARPKGWVAWSTSPDVQPGPTRTRSEEHTSELQSLRHLVCR